MMNYYRELTLLPDGDVSLAFLWTKIFTQLHLALAEQKEKEGNGSYGFSFPEYQTREETGEKSPHEEGQEDDKPLEAGMGTKIRIFAATREQLEALPLDHYLLRYEDYMHLTRIRPVREGRIKGYACYSRYQPDANRAAKARRFARRHDVSYEKALRIVKRRKETYDLPFIQLRSLSNGHGYSLFIQKKEREEPEEGTFSSYGLSHTATVPEF